MVKKVYFESYGCPSNRSDLEIMLSEIVKAGYGIVDDLYSADVILINTCAVKGPTESRMVNRLRFFKSLGKPVIVAGCLPKINLSAVRKVLGGKFVALDPQSIDKITYAIEAAWNDCETLIFSDETPVKSDLNKLRLNPILEVIQIAEGCVGSCTYCCVRFARGRLRSFPVESILRRVKDAVRDGVKEIWLTAQDTGAYGRDLGVDLTDLLEGICRIDGDFLVRVGMINPLWFRKMQNRLENILRENRRIFRFLHIPVQSGDDGVLKNMNRGYNVKEFKRIVASLRENIPRISIATDVICGFPSESDEAFRNTVRLIETVKPEFLNISKFFPRPGTPMWGAKTLLYSIVKERSKFLTDLHRKLGYDINRSWIGWKGEVLIDEKGKGESWIGRNFAYKPIVIQSQENLLGKFLNVKIIDACSTYLKADILD